MMRGDCDVDSGGNDTNLVAATGCVAVTRASACCGTGRGGRSGAPPLSPGLLVEEAGGREIDAVLAVASVRLLPLQVLEAVEYSSEAG
ncbi:hypothetical protein E2562_016931 [Oryza meyeriana var. granulata]|uniref:Uncharacterized protein n=1 Tax=Oryza meyeriana var. granulata TaxID=110450 RepID=A0A6G1DX92_9ORYZ|nr:hypothetical protein E2562_016931 [Oryza meyeriana var. granulata]